MQKFQEFITLENWQDVKQRILILLGYHRNKLNDKEIDNCERSLLYIDGSSDHCVGCRIGLLSQYEKKLLQV